MKDREAHIARLSAHAETSHNLRHVMMVTQARETNKAVRSGPTRSCYSRRCEDQPLPAQASRRIPPHQR